MRDDTAATQRRADADSQHAHSKHLRLVVETAVIVDRETVPSRSG
jgi:hypothetical protein